MAQQRVSTVNKCLFCNKSQPSSGEKSECYVEVNGKERKAFWICDRCGSLEKDRTRALHGIVLAESKIREGLTTSKETSVVQVVTVDTKVSADVSKQRGDENDSLTDSCCCQGCVERKRFQQEQLREAQNLKKCWLQLRHGIRQVYRDRLLKGCVSSKGKKVDVLRLFELMENFCARDPHQLYQRVESLAHHHVMELKVPLLQMLICPSDKTNVSTIPDGEATSVALSAEIAENFVRSVLACAGQFIETVDNMRFMTPLEAHHLERFGTNWRIVNCSLFDSIIYRDPIVQSTLPFIYSRLGFKTVTDGGANENIISVAAERSSVPVHIADMVKNFFDLGSTLSVCRNRMDLAQQRMEEYFTHQMKVYRATLKAKQKVLKHDLEFFKRQRQLLEEYVVKKKELNKGNVGDEDVAALADTLRCLISSDSNCSNDEHSASTAECGRCHRSHCPCDQCTISHLIACGLTSDNCDAELLEDIPFLEDLKGSLDFSDTESEESNIGADDGVLAKSPKMDVICHKRSSIICGGGKKITTVEATIVPSSLYAPDYASKSVARRDTYNGDWEVNPDPSTLLFSSRWEELLLTKCAKQRDNSVTEIELTTASIKECSKNTSEQGSASSKGNSGKPTVGNKLTSPFKPSPNSTGAKITLCKRHSITSTMPYTPSPSPTPGAKSDSSNGNDQPSVVTKHKCELKFHRNGSCTSPMKSPCAAGAACKVQGLHCQQPQFTQEWFKDPKNAKYAKALLACAVAGNSKDAAFLKEFNLDAETMRKMYAEYVNSGDGQKQKSVPTTKAQQDAVSADEDDDSWSDNSSSQKENKHCDCCYCEMFGHGGNDLQKSYGRDEYPQIRERLRLKLRKKESQQHSRVAQNVDGYRGHEDLDSLLEYINGSPKAETASAKGKKSRMKGKRNENKTEKQDQVTVSSHASPLYQTSGTPKSKSNGNTERKMKNGCDASVKGPSAVKQKSELVGATEENGDSENDDSPQLANATSNMGKLQLEENEEDENIDEIFKPKDIDLNSDMDEAERDIECFKRFVMDCQPRANRAKVQLNMGDLLREKKTTAAM